MKSWITHEFHPLCTLFPQITGAEFDALVADIAANGLQNPIVLLDDMVLDGGNRYRACQQAGVEPRFVQFTGADPVGYVLTMNLHRRHLSQGQAATVVAAAQDWGRAQAHGGARVSSAHGEHLNDSTKERAKQSGASVVTQRRADAVAKADPELAKKVAHGETSLTKAVEQVAPQLAPRKPDAKPAPLAIVPNPEIEELRDRLTEMAAALKETMEENASQMRILEANDQVVAALAECKRYREQARLAQERINGLMNEKSEAVRRVGSLERKLKKLGRADLAA